MSWQRTGLIISAGLGLTALTGAGVTWSLYRDDLQKAEKRISNQSLVIQTRSGNLEYAVAGQGPWLMMLHGTGGGFDQGLRFAEGLIRRDHRVIAPSRFGYLRSDFPQSHISEDQADALVELLDHLHLRKIPVVGGSAGALSAAQFAIRHPDRCAALILLVPAANVRGTDPVEMTRLQKAMVAQLLTSDFFYWLGLRTAPKRMLGTMLATDPKLLDLISPYERTRAFTILEDMMPVSRRSRGILNDALLAGHPALMDFRQLRVPTLIISAEDDRFGTAQTARDIAAKVANAKLVIYAKGGHIWLGHDEQVADEITRFIGRLPT